jgi:hypothetical protein
VTVSGKDDPGACCGEADGFLELIGTAAFVAGNDGGSFEGYEGQVHLAGDFDQFGEVAGGPVDAVGQDVDVEAD